MDSCTPGSWRGLMDTSDHHRHVAERQLRLTRETGTVVQSDAAAAKVWITPLAAVRQTRPEFRLAVQRSPRLKLNTQTCMVEST